MHIILLQLHATKVNGRDEYPCQSVCKQIDLIDTIKKFVIKWTA